MNSLKRKKALSGMSVKSVNTVSHNSKIAEVAAKGEYMYQKNPGIKDVLAFIGALSLAAGLSFSIACFAEWVTKVNDTIDRIYSVEFRQARQGNRLFDVEDRVNYLFDELYKLKRGK